MDLRTEDLPATIQAFDLRGDKEVFIAEQVVNSQSEIETFTKRYRGKLIKIKKVPVVTAPEPVSYVNTLHPAYRQPRSRTGIAMIIIIIIIVVLVIYGFSTGWIQEKLNLKV